SHKLLALAQDAYHRHLHSFPTRRSSDLRDVPFICEAPIPDAAHRTELWRRNLNGDTPPGLDLAGTMAQFRLTAEQVHRAARAARMEAHAREVPLDEDELKAGARAQNAAGLERLARRIQPAVGFADLVLPPD